MAYITNFTNEIIVDAILTTSGRELLSKNGALNITKFAVADDEIDYTLYNTSNPNGTDDYDVAIRKLPILEALPKDRLNMRYKITYLPEVASNPNGVQYIMSANFATELTDGTAYTNTAYNINISTSFTSGTDAYKNTYFIFKLYGLSTSQKRAISIIGYSLPDRTSISTIGSISGQDYIGAIGHYFSLMFSSPMEEASISYGISAVGPITLPDLSGTIVLAATSNTLPIGKGEKSTF